MGGEETAFLEAIIAEPDDDVHRLVFADWLEEHGDPRGAFIRAQIELARLPSAHPNRMNLESQLAERQRSVGDAYQRVVPSEIACFFPRGNVYPSGCERGFPARADVYADKVNAFILQAPLLFRYAPIRELTLLPEVIASSGGDFMVFGPSTVSLQAFLGIPELFRIRELHFYSGPFEDLGEFARLVSSCPNLDYIQRLGFGELFSTFDIGPRLPMNDQSRRILIERFGDRLVWLPDRRI